MINWHTEYRSRKLIEKLDPSNVSKHLRVAIPADYFIYVGDDEATRRTLSALKDRRQRAVERAFGARFEDLETSDQCRDYLALDAQAPEVDAVIEEALVRKGGV
jgi:hypothetical protein